VLSVRTLTIKPGARGGVTRRLDIGGRVVDTPVFTPTLNSWPSTWVWRQGAVLPMVTLPLNELMERPALLARAREQGVHRALNYPGAVLVDSGAYFFGTRHIEKDVLEILALQQEIGADVAIVLDVIPLPDQTPAERRRSIKRTLENAERVKARAPELPLEAIVHGVEVEDYVDSARALLALDFDMYGVSVSSKLQVRDYASAVALVRAVRSVIPLDKPLHALGCGSPKMLSLLAYHGADVFDSTRYVMKAAFNQLESHRTECVRADRSGVPPLRCALCQNANLDPESKLPEPQQVLHNLLEIQKENQRLICAIDSGTLEDYLRVRLPPALHPLLDA